MDVIYLLCYTCNYSGGMGVLILQRACYVPRERLHDIQGVCMGENE